jgi:CheY-like chemotaxis protein
LGVCAYLSKPARQTDLRNAIAGAFESHSQRPQPTAGEEQPAKTPPADPLRILLAEDNLVNQRLAMRLLEKEGHVVVAAANGTEAMTAWLNQTFDLILMDMQMPEMDGVQTTSAIRRAEAALGTHIPIVALTAHAMIGDRERCLSAGMDDYLSKPIRKSDLLETIGKHTRPAGRLALTPEVRNAQAAVIAAPVDQGQTSQAIVRSSRVCAVPDHQSTLEAVGQKCQ